MMDSFLDPAVQRLVAGFVIGLLLGGTLVLTRFCTMGAVADIAIMGDYTRMRAWLLAIVVAITATQLLIQLGPLDLTSTIYLRPHLTWAGGAVGGLMFGFGMVIACGCGARNLSMVGRGDLRALITVLFIGISAYVTLRGLLSVPRQWFMETTTVVLPVPQDLGGLLARLTGLTDSAAGWTAMLLVTAPTLVFIFKDRSFLNARTTIVGAIAVGLLVFCAWVATGVLFIDEFDVVHPRSLTFVGPVGDTLRYAMLTPSTTFSFGSAAVLGLVLGAWGGALKRGVFHVQGFEDASEMGRYIAGGVLMGAGGMLAGGCTFGQGITGVSTLGLSSFIALAAIVLGGIMGVRYLEHGSIISALRGWRGE